MLDKSIEAVRPAAVMRVAGRGRFEQLLLQRKLGSITVQIGERQCHQSLGTMARNATLLPREGKD